MIRQLGHGPTFVEAVSKLSPGAHQLTIERVEGGAKQQSFLQLSVDEGQGVGIDFLTPSAEVGVDDPSSPAGKAGLQTGDIIYALDGVEIKSFFELQAKLARQEKSHEKVSISY